MGMPPRVNLTGIVLDTSSDASIETRLLIRLLLILLISWTNLHLFIDESAKAY